MKRWEIQEEEASIVLLGGFNPSIFHPEWFIRHGLMESWDYSESEIINVPDLSKIEFPSDRALEVLQGRFTYRTTIASNHLALKDLVISTFSILTHTPVMQLGLNYKASIHIPDSEDWYEFGLKLAPIDLWKKAAPYIEDLEDAEKMKQLGLIGLKMQLPRPDEHMGRVNVEIANVVQKESTIAFSVNSHISLCQDDARDAVKAVEIIEENWELSLRLSKVIVNSIMESHLRNRI